MLVSGMGSKINQMKEGYEQIIEESAAAAKKRKGDMSAEGEAL